MYSCPFVRLHDHKVVEIVLSFMARW